MTISAHAQAMDFDLVRDATGEEYLVAKGEIVAGDRQRIEDLLDLGRVGARRIVLNSQGGDLLEGVMLGRLLNYRGFETYVAEGGYCFSACFFAFAGGEYRYVFQSSRLGVHQFSGGFDSAKESQFVTGMLMEALDEFGIAAQALTAALLTLPDDIHVFTREELDRHGIVTPIPAGYFASREASALGISPREYRRRYDAYIRSNEECLSLPESARPYCSWAQRVNHGLRR